MPGPQDYNVTSAEPRYIIRGPVDTKFGTTQNRDSLIARDISKSPFKNPTNLENPSPVAYNPRNNNFGDKNFCQTSTDFLGNNNAGGSSGSIGAAALL